MYGSMENVEPSFDQVQQFRNTFNLVLDKISANINNDPALFELLDWVQEVYKSNVNNGKHMRGLFVITANQLIAENMNKALSEEDKLIANLLGWILEMHQAYALMMNDIMDGSEMRRGQPCWYKRVIV